MDYKVLAKQFLEEIKAETIATRKCLERIPESTYKFKPHEKSMEMGYLTQMVADIPRWIDYMIRESKIDFATYKQFPLSTTQALVDHYDKNVKSVLDALEKITEQQVKSEFVLRNGEQVYYTAPKLQAISETINHWVHHRGQLTVYMRLNDIAVPSIYGPSADDKGF